MSKFLDQAFLNNSILSWISAIFVVVLSFVFIRILKSVVLLKARKWASTTSTSWDDYLINTIEHSVVPILYIVFVYFATKILTLPQNVGSVLRIAFLISVTFFVLRILSSAFRKFIYLFIGTQENSEAKQKQAAGLIVIVNCVIWILGAIFMIDNLGYNVTSLIAGLGIGGIAIALAAQTILGDLFSYFVIFFDRPFEIGDFVVIDDKSGVVEYIGIKTTRLRTLGGEQLVCANTDLTNSRLHNYKRLQQRRILFNLGVTYQTPHELLVQSLKCSRILSPQGLMFAWTAPIFLATEILALILKSSITSWMPIILFIWTDSRKFIWQYLKSSKRKVSSLHTPLKPFSCSTSRHELIRQ